MLSNGQVIGDGSWDLRVFVTELNTERMIRVKGDLHIGGVMLRLVEDMEITNDWSDHAIWWPQKNRWLSNTRLTLNQLEVQADAILHFTSMHKQLTVQLPDLRYLNLRVDFSINTFSTVISLCKDLSIRYPEELSLAKPLESINLKYNFKHMPKKKVEQNGVQRNGHLQPDTNTFIGNHSPDGSTGSLEKSGFSCTPVTPTRSPHSAASMSTPMGQNGTWKRNGFGNNVSGYSPNVNNSVSLEELNGSLNHSLAQSPTSVTPECRRTLVRPKTLVERARMNVAWLDSSLSIMEQGVKEGDTLCLRFKFYSFYDLNPKYDAVRINQIYEQAKWQLLNEEIDCTEEEMLMFAALQLQTNIQANEPQPNIENGNSHLADDDDIDAALTDLQTTLEGVNVDSIPNDITQVPELYNEMRFMKPKKFGFNSYKRLLFSYRDLNLYLYKTREEMIHRSAHYYSISLQGCEVTPEVNISQRKYIIKLEVAEADGMTEMRIKCDNEDQYATWMAACKLAAKGRSLADSSYKSEVESIKQLLQLQKPGDAPTVNPSAVNINPEDYVAPRFVKKLKGKLVQRILEANSNVKDLPLMEAKLNYIKAWQSLPEYGLTLFVVQFMGQKKEELLGVAHNRIMKMDINTGMHIHTWRYSSLKAWNVNWKAKHMMTQFEDTNIIFSCLSADCKVVHEFIGGYIFLSMRSKEASQTLNEELFHKLTGGWT